MHRPYKSNQPRKPFRQVSTLDALTERQEAELQSWFLVEEKLTYRAAITRIKERYGVKVSHVTIFNFWHKYVAPIIAKRTGQTGDIAKETFVASSLDHLNPDQLAQLIVWLQDEQIQYAEARERLSKRFGVHVCVSTLSRFYQRKLLLIISASADGGNEDSLEVSITLKTGGKEIKASGTFPVLVKNPLPKP